MLFYGIDPGLTGGISAINSNRELAFAVEMPLKQKHLDTCAIASMIRKTPKCFCVLEQALPMPAQSSTSTATTFLNYGKLIAVLEINKIPYQIIHPSKWKKQFQLTKKSKYDAADTANSLFPELSFITKRGRLMDGMAESLLLAEYARRIYCEKI